MKVSEMYKMTEDRSKPLTIAEIEAQEKVKPEPIKTTIALPVAVGRGIGYRIKRMFSEKADDNDDELE